RALCPPAPLGQLLPVLRGLLGRELGRLGDMAAAPDHDRVAPLQVFSLQVGVGALAGEEARAVLGLLRPSLRAHRTALAAAQLVELLWPLHPADVSIAPEQCPRPPKSSTSAPSPRS